MGFIRYDARCAHLAMALDIPLSFVEEHDDITMGNFVSWLGVDSMETEGRSAHANLSHGSVLMTWTQ